MLPRHIRKNDLNSTENNYVTRHVGLASVLLYQNPASYVCTRKAAQCFPLFEFAAPDDCLALETLFFSKEGVAVADARALLDCSKSIRETVAEAAKAPDGVYWGKVQ
jgi:hypothetical protein